MKLPENATVFVESAEPAGDFKLRLKFSDGAEPVLDFGPFLRASSNPRIREYLDPARFAQFTITDGDLVWGDYDLCFAIADLYEGTI
jgi:hypothetical protein